MRSGGMTDVKLMNRRMTYEYIRNKLGQVVSRPEVAKALGITEPTVLKITSFFLERGILTEAGEADIATVGRKPNMLSFNAETAYCAGVDYDGSRLNISIVNMNYETVAFTSQKLKVTLGELFNDVIPSQINQIDCPKNKIIGLGLAIPAVVDTKKYTIKMRNPIIDLGNQTDFSMQVRTLSQSLGMPVFMENDVNAAAVCEFKSHRIRSNDDFIFIMLGIGVGAGLVLGGKLRHGKHYSCGEIGYMSFDKAFKIQEDRPGHLESLMGRLYGEDGQEAIENVAAYTALCIANMSSSLDVNNFVIGGYFAERYGDNLTKLIKGYCDDICIYPVEIILDTDKDVVARGMGAIVADGVLDNFLSDEFQMTD